MSEIDLTRLPAPDAVEVFTFEEIFARKKAQLISLMPAAVRADIAAVLDLESEPLTIDLQQQAYSEMLIRQRINEATRAGFLALAAGADLDHIGAGRGLERKIVQQGNSEAVPPIPEIKESDVEYRRRIQLHPEKFAAAGPRAAYIAHALDVEDVADANPVRPTPGMVRVYIKSYTNNGVPSSETIGAVRNHLSAEERRPLNDLVEIVAGRAKEIAVEYETVFESGPDKALVAEKQRQDLDAVIAGNTRLGDQLALSKIIGALDVPGAKKVRLISPSQDVVCEEGEFIRVSSITAREVLS